MLKRADLGKQLGELRTRACLSLALLVTLEGCGQAPGGADQPKTGTMGMALRVSAGVIIPSANYVVRAPDATIVRVGSIDTPIDPGAGVTVTLPGLPPAVGYRIVVTADLTGVDVTCTGGTFFDVLAGVTTQVVVRLLCVPRSRGVLLVNGTLNMCPLLDSLAVIPAEAVVGGSVAITASASDADNGPMPLTYNWTVSSGTVNGTTGPAATFTCLTPGLATVGLLVSDGDPDPTCADSITVKVSCTVP